jgi:DUF4097 and DUF4098 domain-containing protein YvlB
LVAAIAPRRAAAAKEAAAAAPSSARSFQFATRALTLGNAIGQISIGESRTAEFTVTIQLHGDQAEKLVVTREENRLTIGLGDSPAKRYIYPTLDSRKVTLGKSSDKELRRLGFGKRKIQVRGNGDGPVAWADVSIGVPAEAHLTVVSGVGGIEAANLRADLNARIRHGNIEVNQCSGTELLLDTGSGNVHIRGAGGEKLSVDTGSGNVKLADIQVRALTVDTGSGAIRVAGTEAEKVRLDTGSGSIHVAPATLISGDWKADVGSGAIEIILPSQCSAHLVADTSSGRIAQHLAAAEVLNKSRGHMELRIGSGAAQILLDTSSGNITIRGQ